MKVGDYVRTKNGINKIIYIDDIFGSDGKHSFYTIRLDCDNLIFDEEVIKTSPNIIDLIEVGDIVNYEQLNGGVVLNKKDDSIDTWSILPNSLKNEDIKSVITKEQLKNCMYEVDE